MICDLKVFCYKLLWIIIILIRIVKNLVKREKLVNLRIKLSLSLIIRKQ